MVLWKCKKFLLSTRVLRQYRERRSKCDPGMIVSLIRPIISLINFLAISLRIVYIHLMLCISVNKYIYVIYMYICFLARLRLPEDGGRREETGQCMQSVDETNVH